MLVGMQQSRSSWQASRPATIDMLAGIKTSVSCLSIAYVFWTCSCCNGSSVNVLIKSCQSLGIPLNEVASLSEHNTELQVLSLKW